MIAQQPLVSLYSKTQLHALLTALNQLLTGLDGVSTPVAALSSALSTLDLQRKPQKHTRYSEEVGFMSICSGLTVSDAVSDSQQSPLGQAGRKEAHAQQQEAPQSNGTISTKKPLASIQRLPHELLLEIFSFCELASMISTDIMRDREGSIVSVMDAKIPVAALRQVCSMWNRLVSSTPSLWARLIIDLNVDFVDLSWGTTQAIQNVLHDLLRRSSETPLDVSIALSSYWSQAGSGLLPILEQSHRWKRLSLCVSTGQINDQVFTCYLSRELPKLTSLEIEVHHDGHATLHRPSSSGHATPWFSNVPSLRTVKQSSSCLVRFAFPWAQLETLENLDGKTLDDVYTLKHVDTLSGATSLRKLSCGVHSCLIYRPGAQKPPLLINSLYTTYDGDLRFLSSFTFPHLVDLTIGEMSGRNAPEFFAQVAPNLHRLTFEGDDTPFLMNFFRGTVVFPELQELIIERSGSVGTFDADLYSLRDRFPKLVRLVCRLYQETSLDNWYDLFCAFIPLPSVTSTSAWDAQLVLPFPFCDAFKKLVDLWQRGVKIRFLGYRQKEVLWDPKSVVTLYS